jgi:hypothetical protein
MVPLDVLLRLDARRMRRGDSVPRDHCSQEYYDRKRRECEAERREGEQVASAESISEYDGVDSNVVPDAYDDGVCF